MLEFPFQWKSGIPGASRERNDPLLGTYSGTISRVPQGSLGGVLFFMGEVPMYQNAGARTRCLQVLSTLLKETATQFL